MSDTQIAPVDKSGERVRRMFAGVAKRYDLLNHLLSLNVDRRWRRFVVRTVVPAGTDPILDVCTGTGDLALGYAAAGQAPVTGSDFCAPMLDIARGKAAKSGRAVEFVEADTLDLPFESGRFQIVSNAFGLRNVGDTDRGIAEMVRVLRPGGRLAVLEFSRPRVPVLRTLYLWYFKHLLPRIGQRVSGSGEDAYHYLPDSVMQFPDGPEMVERLAAAGLADCSATPLTLGIATLYVGTKPQ